jgi:hypothetical protein
MSGADDRIAVPTNGHRPPLALEPKPETPDAEDRTPRPPGVAIRRGVAIEANPAALVVGFGVVAWLVVILVGARRRRS